MNYNNSQQRAIRHKDGPMLVIAGPGSGKTSTLCQRVFNLVKEYGISENKILILTFTKKAAIHMKERYELLAKKNSESKFSTIHSLCYSILKDYRHTNSLNILSEKDKIKIIKRLILEEFGETDIDESTLEILLELLYKFAISNEMHKEFNADIIKCGILKSYEGLKYFSERLENEKRKMGVLDYDDLLYETRRAFIENKGFLKKWQGYYDYFLIDEFQDTNEIQFDIIARLAENYNNIFAVGDDDQSVYGFRGALPDIMKRFLHLYDNTETVFLDTNYRSTPKIVSFSNKLISVNKDRMPKVMKTVNSDKGTVGIRRYPDRKTQYRQILSEIFNNNGKSENDNTAVLLRTNFQKEQFINEMQLFPGLNGNNNECIKNKYVYEEVAAFFRVISKNFGMEDVIKSMNIFNGTISKFLMPKRKEDLNNWTSICIACNEEKEALAVTEYINMIEFCEKLTPQIAFLTIAQNEGFKNMVKSKFENDINYTSFWEKLKTNINNSIIDCKEFFDAASKIDKIEVAGKDGNVRNINVLTMHESKGLEFDNVYIPDLNIGLMPINRAVGDDAIEEERRLLYVALTRAKRNLMLSYYETVNGRETKASGFIDELIIN